MGFGNQLPLLHDLLPPEQVVWEEAKHTMPSTAPIVDGNLDPNTSELLIMAMAHGDILHVENYQRWATHLANGRLNFLGLNRRDILFDEVDWELARGCRRLINSSRVVSCGSVV